MTTPEQMDLSIIEFPPEVRQRIQNAREVGGMSPSAAAVLDLLDEWPLAAGAKNAKPIASMQEAWRSRGMHVWSDRMVKAAVKELLEEHEVPVGSTRRRDEHGYFLICSDEDRRQAEGPLASEIISLARRLRTINPKSRYARLLMGQQELGTQ